LHSIFIFTSVFQWITQENLTAHDNFLCGFRKLGQLYSEFDNIDREVSALTDVYLLTFLFLETIAESRPFLALYTMDHFKTLHGYYREIIVGLAKWLWPQDPPRRAPCSQDVVVEQMHHICADYMRLFERLFQLDGNRSDNDKAFGCMWYVSFSLAPLTHLHFGLNDFSQDRTNSSSYVGDHVRSPFSSQRQ
jgi:hypothetical protein